MLTQKEKEFCIYWKNNREELGKPLSKFLRGIPMAVLFVLPILLLLLAVYLFSPEWYTKVAPQYGGSFSAIFVALIICIIFISYFRMQWHWENNEQNYEELKRKKELESSESASK